MEVDGRSMAPLLKGVGAPKDWRDALLLEVAYSRAVVTDEWKYIAVRFPEAIQSKVREVGPGKVSWDGVVRRFEQEARWGDKKGDVSTDYGGHKDFPAYFDPDQLYDLKKDPYEQTNLAGDPAHAAQVRKMKALLTQQLATLPHAFGEFTTE